MARKEAISDDGTKFKLRPSEARLLNQFLKYPVTSDVRDAYRDGWERAFGNHKDECGIFKEPSQECDCGRSR